MRIRILFTLITLAMVVGFGSIVSAGIDDGLIVYYPFDILDSKKGAHLHLN